MAFVNELISEDDKARFDWGRFKWSRHRPGHRPWKWTIDRDKNAFLVMLVGRGREGEHPAMYALCWEGDIIQFFAEIDRKGTLSTGVELHWKVFDLEMKIPLFEKMDAIKKLLRDAIDAFGNVYDRTGVQSVSVTFVPQLDRKMLDASMPGAVTELTYVERRYVRYEKESLLDNYEVPRERRTVLPVLGGIVMIGLFGLWVYMHWTGSLSTEQFIVRGVRRGGAFVVFWWILFLLILVGGVASIKVGIRNWKANRE